MRDVSPTQPTFTELAQLAFAANGYVPSTEVLGAAAKNLARLSAPLASADTAGADIDFEKMLRSCAGV